ncbi:MAG: ribosome maturation factor RimP [Raineya sp.]|nr:ribosome maturation factor RimP [Raineya sp.]
MKTKIWQATENILEKEFFIIDVIIKELREKYKVSVVLDGDEGINIDTCAKISRELGNIIDENNWIESRYVLEVSSPGAENPLKLLRQVPKHIGRTLQIATKDNKTYEGVLKSVKNETITIEQTSGKGKKAQTQLHQIEWANINSIKVLISFK